MSGVCKMTGKQKKQDLHLMIDPVVLKKVKKTIPNRRLSAFVQDIFERELAGEYHQAKIDALEQQLAMEKSQNNKIQTEKQEQEERSSNSYKQAEEEMLQRRKADMARRKEGF